MGTTNIPINKGNYSLDSEKREKAFHKKIGEGWAAEYALYRKNWKEYPGNRFVSEYPLLVDLELSTSCNLRCPMCYTTTERFKNRVKTKMMSYGLYRRIIDEIGGRVPAIRLSLRGEPTLHPRFLDCIAYAKKNGIGEVSALTNGSTLTKNFFKQVMDAGMDWLTISIDGLGRTYENIRKPLKFRDTLRRVVEIKAIKDKNNTHKPVIKIQSIWPAIRNAPEKFYDTFSPYADLIAFNPLIDYLGRDKEITYEPDFNCPQLYQRLVIGADGRAMMCSNDEDGSRIIGDANKESVYDIWHGEKLDKARSIHGQKNGFMRITVCRKCYLPRATDGTEKVKVNGRYFFVKNYIGRKQSIGK